MKFEISNLFLAVLLSGMCILCPGAMVGLPGSSAYAAEKDLPSWKDGATRTRIVRFVKAVSDKRSKDYVAPADRVAVFDNDGTLWCEKPIYPQFIFALDRVQSVVDERPELGNEPLFKSALSKDFDALAKSGAHGIQRLIGVTHGGMTSDKFDEIVANWMVSSKHPRFKRPFNKCVYKPMLELLEYLRKNQFSTYIVSGGGRDFMRPWAGATYGIGREQVVGSSCKLEYKDGDVFRTETIAVLNDGKEKPVGIQCQIGKRPIAAFGNSDGDLEMLMWTDAKDKKRKGPSLCALVRHTDMDREYSYDKDSKVGRLDKALKEARERNWLVVDMKEDWLKIFPFE